MILHNNYRRYQALQEHHIFGGCPNRTHSGHYGLKVYLCNIHHLAGTGPEAVHANKKIMAMLHEDGQRAFEENWGSRTEVYEDLRKNFIMEDKAMMDIGDVKKVIDNVAQKPFLCSDTEN